MKAIKLFCNPENESCFVTGEIPEMEHIAVDYFFLEKKIENYERGPHTAPRFQFVVTQKGRLRFTVTDGNTFIIEPGVILIADDLTGKGHRWEIIDGKEWHRIYIVPKADAADHFIADSK